jgi:hypothetical protein
MRFWRKRIFDSRQYLLNAAAGLYKRSDWTGKEFLEWLQMFSHDFSDMAFAQSTDDLRIEKIKLLQKEIMKNFAPIVNSRGNAQRKVVAEKLYIAMNEIFATGKQNEEPHIFVEYLANTSVKAAMKAMSDFGASEAEASLALGMKAMTGLMAFAEYGPSLDTTNVSKTGMSAGLAKRYDSLTRPHLLVGEIVLNAGASYLPADGNSGDGTFVITDNRFLFIFDEEFRKTPISISRQDLSAFEFRPTDVVPMSEELYLAFSNFGKTEILAIFVGRFFAAEIRNLLS